MTTLFLKMDHFRNSFHTISVITRFCFVFNVEQVAAVANGDGSGY